MFFFKFKFCFENFETKNWLKKLSFFLELHFLNECNSWECRTKLVSDTSNELWNQTKKKDFKK